MARRYYACVADYRKRLADSLIEELLAALPAVAVVGPRASGKTTTAARHARSVVRLDRAAEAFAVIADPDAALSGLEEPVLLDEWQEVPEVLGAVKRACDAEPRPGRFILTGSVRAETRTRTWPGTGRVTRVELLPLTVGEQLGTEVAPLVDRIARSADAGEGRPPYAAVPAGERPSLDLGTGFRDDRLGLRDYLAMAIRGGFPQAVLASSDRARRSWLESYVHEVVTRDVEAAGGSPDSVRMRRYFEAYALNSAGVADDTTIYGAAGIDRRTALAYRGLLDRIHVVDELPAWTSNRLKRLSLAPKWFLIDSSLLASVTGATEASAMRDGDLLGRLLETFVVAQLRAQATVSDHRCSLFHLRQHHGRHEVDVVAELDAQHVIGIEIKATASPSAADARHIAWLRDQVSERFLAGIVLHTGPAVLPLGRRIWALPISALWS